MNPLPLLSTLKPIVPARTNRPANAKRCATAVPGYGWPQKLLQPLLLALSLVGGRVDGIFYQAVFPDRPEALDALRSAGAPPVGEYVA